MFVFDISTRFACSTLLFSSLSLDDALAAIAKTKLSYVDLWSTPDTLMHVDPERDSAGELKAKLEDNNLRPSSISAHATFGSDLVKRLDLAAAIGAPLVIGTAPVREYERREASDDVRALGRAAQERRVQRYKAKYHHNGAGPPVGYSVTTNWLQRVILNCDCNRRTHLPPVARDTKLNEAQ